MSPDRADRRSFLTRAGALAAAAAIAPPWLHSLAGERRTAHPSADWDLRWLDHLTGKHKHFFDLSDAALDQDPLRTVRNYLAAVEEVFGLKGPEVTTIVGITRGYPMLAADAVWTRYGLGEQWKIKAADGSWADRNPLAEQVAALQAQGTLFWQCNNTLTRIVAGTARRTGEPEAAVYQTFREGLLPGVLLVPAHTLLVGLVQERGVSYQKP